MPSLFHLPPIPPVGASTPMSTAQHLHPSNYYPYHIPPQQPHPELSGRASSKSMPHPVVYPHDDRYHRRPLEPSTNTKAGLPDLSSIQTPKIRKDPSSSSPPAIPRSTTSFTGCHCKKSRCLKLYCPCFAAKKFCEDASCQCEDCQNLTRHAKLVEQIRTAAFNKHSALKKSLTITTSSFETSTVPLLSCKCVRSECLKKYCECYHHGMYCTESCRCHNCQNIKPKDSVTPSTSSNRQTPPQNWNHPPSFHWNQTQQVPPYRSMPMPWNVRPPVLHPMQPFAQSLSRKRHYPIIQPPYTEAQEHNQTTNNTRQDKQNDERGDESKRSIKTQNPNSLSPRKELLMDNHSKNGRIEHNGDNEDQQDDDVDETMLAALAMTQLSGKRKCQNDMNNQWTPASKVSKSSSFSGGSESRNPSPVYRASPVVRADPPPLAVESSSSSSSSVSLFQQQESTTTLQQRHNYNGQSTLRTPRNCATYRNEIHFDRYSDDSRSYPIQTVARNLYNPCHTPQKYYPSSIKESRPSSIQYFGLPRSLSFRKICSRCGKTRAEHGELGFGNKCPYEECGKCGAHQKLHSAVGISMGITCTLTTAQGAIPGATEMYHRKIQNLAERAELQRSLKQQQQPSTATTVDRAM